MKHTLSAAIAVTLLTSGLAYAGALDHPGNSLNAQQAKKYSLVGKVIQRTKDGLLVDCGQQKRQAAGYAALTGLVWLTGYDAQDGSIIKLAVISDGTYSYTTVTGAESMVDAFIPAK